MCEHVYSNAVVGEGLSSLDVYTDPLWQCRGVET